MSIVIDFNNVEKQYLLGSIGIGILSQYLNCRRARVRCKETFIFKIRETNGRVQKGNCNFVWFFKEISFKVEQGDAVGLIGKNGAVKSTLYRIILPRLLSKGSLSLDLYLHYPMIVVIKDAYSCTLSCNGYQDDFGISLIPNNEESLGLFDYKKYNDRSYWCYGTKHY